MKKVIIMLAAALITGAALAALDTSLLQYDTAIHPVSVASGAAVSTGVVIDKMPFTGVATIIVQLGVNTGATVQVALESAPNATGTYAAVTGATAELTGTNGALETITYDTTAGNRYVRLSITNEAAGATAIISGSVVSYK